MEASGPSRKMYKPTALETTQEAPEPVETEPPHQHEGRVDRISNLPDAVLGDIISLLPTDEGACTQILSSRWRHLWLSAPLNLDCTDLHYGHHGESAAAVVSRILSSHSGPGRRLRMEGDHFDLGVVVAAVHDWLQSGALNNLQELELAYQYRETHAPLLSYTFRFAPTLRVATLKKCNLPDNIIQGLHFPLLKQLGLDFVRISECSMHIMIASCPALECLLIKGSIGFHCLRISSLTLKSVGVDNFINPYISGVRLKELIIENLPSLEKLLLHFGTAVHVDVVAAPQLQTIGYLSDHQDHLNRLVFGSTIIQGLYVDNLAMAVHTVKTLAVEMNNLSLDTVIQLMTCFPCLEKLYIQASKSEPNNLWRPKQRSQIGCLDIRLKTLVLDSYRGNMSQINFVTFFVLNVKVLELVILDVRSMHYSEELLEEQRRKLQLEKRASLGAQIHFATHRCVRSYWDINHVRDLDLVDPFSLQC